MRLPTAIDKLYHRQDPESSKLAIERVPRPRACDTVYQLLRKYPGRTSAELHRVSTRGLPAELSLLDIRRRLSDLRIEPQPRARHGKQRKCHVAGTKAVTWWPVGAPDGTRWQRLRWETIS
jgi:hypothetical protein